MIIRKIILGLVFISIANFSFGQENTVATGGEASGATGSVSYSVGQVSYLSNSGGSGSTSEGVQQPFEIYTVTDIGDNLAGNINLVVYPNPTAGILNLMTENASDVNLSYEIYTVSGKVLERENINTSVTNIQMKEYPPAIYYLRVVNQGKALKTFKIVKNK